MQNLNINNIPNSETEMVGIRKRKFATFHLKLFMNIHFTIKPIFADKLFTKIPIICRY